MALAEEPANNAALPHLLQITGDILTSAIRKGSVAFSKNHDDGECLCDRGRNLAVLGSSWPC